MPYHSIKDILNICKNDECEFWQVVLTEQVQESLASSKSVFEEMRRMYRIMKTAVNEYDENAVSAGKMAGGGGELMHKYNQKERKLLGDFLSLAAEYSIKTADYKKNVDELSELLRHRLPEAAALFPQFSLHMSNITK